jgi:hypothetical protein
MELRAGDWVKTLKDELGKVVHISRFTVFVALNDYPKADRVEGLSASSCGHARRAVDHIIEQWIIMRKLPLIHSPLQSVEIREHGPNLRLDAAGHPPPQISSSDSCARAAESTRPIYRVPHLTEKPRHSFRFPPAVSDQNAIRTPRRTYI